MASKQQEQFNLEYDAKKVIAYWQSEYDVTPDAWELAQELEISEKDAEKVLERLAKQSADARNRRIASLLKSGMDASEVDEIVNRIYNK